jgi:hypothetical protein
MFLCSLYSQHGYPELQRQKMATFLHASLSVEILGSAPSIYTFIGSTLPTFKHASFARYSCIFHWTDNIYIVLLLSKLRGWGKESFQRSVR